jgi:hypothetical protein
MPYVLSALSPSREFAARCRSRMVFLKSFTAVSVFQRASFRTEVAQADHPVRKNL